MDARGDVAKSPTRAASVEIDLNIGLSLSVAEYQNGLPLIHGMSLISPEDNHSEMTRVTLTCEPPLFLPKTWSFESLAPGTNSVPINELQVDARVLHTLTERTTAVLTITMLQDSMDETVQMEYLHNVDLLPKNHWGGLSGGLPEIIAAFSQPNDPSIDRLLKQASKVLREAGLPNQLNGYLNGPEHAWRIANAIWLTVANQDFTYILPPKSFEESGQKIRTPESMVQSKIGTCLDLTMLFVSMLEQASLHPVVVFTHGHAFPGFWTTPKAVTSSTNDDPAQIRNALELNELVLFESTLVTGGSPASFTEATASGTRNVAIDVSDQFHLVVDIKQARESGIRPLSSTDAPQTPVDNDVKSAKTHLTLEAVPEGLLAQTTEQVEVAPTTPHDRLDHWQKKLLDLSLRNRLLNFKPGRKTLRIEIDGSGNIEDLVAAGKKLRFAPTAGMAVARPSATQARLESLETEESLSSQVARALENNTLLVKKTREDIDSTLVQLFRDARIAQEEGGSNTLFLAFGYLSWQRPGDTSRSFMAPLILVPVTLDRTSARSGFTIRAHDDGPRFNPTLTQMLYQDFRIQIPLDDHDLPQDGSGVDVEVIWQKVRQCIRDQRGWEVIERVDLATFSFSKYLMWKDLVDRTDSLAKNLVVKQLLEGNADPFPDQGQFPDESTLDANYQPEKVYTPLPADSSQLATVLAASKGKSFVVIGPPGTGKSQTIANVITQALGDGKTVLFVSEKIAALEVVHRRLKHMGLGDYCLELHSNKANKRGVLDQLNAAWTRSGNPDQRNAWLSRSRQLESLRRDLNTYVHELHKRYENGMSLFEAFGIGSTGEHLSAIDFGHTPQASDTRETYQRQEEAASLLQQAHETLPPGTLTNKALALVGEENWTPDFQDRVQNLIQELEQHLLRANTALNALYHQLDATSPDWTSTEIERALAFIELGSAAPDIPLGELVDDNVSLLLDRLTEGARRAHEIETYEQVLGSWWNPPKVQHNLGFKIDELIQKTSHLSVPYSSAIEAINLDQIQSDWQAANKKLFFKGRARKKVQEALARFTQGNIAPDVENDLMHLPGIVSVKSEIRTELASLQSQYAPFSDLATKAPSLWKAVLSGSDILIWARSFTESLKAMLASQPSGATSAIRMKLKRILSSVDAERRTFAEQALAARRAVEATIAPRERLFDLLSTPASEREHFTISGLDKQAKLCTDLLIEIGNLRIWCPWRKAQSNARSVGLDSLVEGLITSKIAPADILATFRVNYARQWARSVTSRTPVISSFTAHAHERKIEDFRNLDSAYSKLSAEIVELRIRASIPDLNAGGRSSPEGILRREIEKKRRHKSIRVLMEEIPNLITNITPCFMMSPLSIAQYLSPNSDLFDVVVFDEASQIPVWDAVGAIARGKQVIMVGDTKQLPPTTFFNRVESDEVDDAIDEDLSSILDECVASSMPLRHLNWHYRSRHESLIAFSNRKYYDGRLITFPSPVTEDVAVSSNYVGGVYERGSSRTNPDEARTVVHEVVAHLRSHPEDTVGIVTFNLQQRDLIESLLDEERRKDSSLEQFFGSDLIEPVMVKNLENVQGDERDVIFFSTTFGYDSAGKMYMNFGPLSSSGGERRLNVAVTRARKRLRVITSIRPEDIELARTRSAGVRDLKLFLDYAIRGVAALDAEIESFGGDADSPFESSVATALRNLGWEVHQQIGVSGFRIDLAIVDPDAPGGYLAGIECDGATYHSSATARDRDQIRESVLRELGWEILRVWSTDWFYGKQMVLDRLQGDLTRLLQKQRARRLAEASTAQEKLLETPVAIIDNSEDNQLAEQREPEVETIAHGAVSVGAPPDELSTSARIPPKPETFEFATPGDLAQLIDPDQFYEPGYTPTLEKMLAHVIDQEGPVRELDLINTIRGWHGWNRTGGRIRQRLTEAVPPQHKTSVEQDGTLFYWAAGVQPTPKITFRSANAPQHQRTVVQISMPELIDLAERCAKRSKDKERVVRSMCAALGIERLSASVRMRLETALESAQRTHG